MMPPNLVKWENSKELSGLLFFAQRMCELLYDKTLDSYKMPALNTHTSVLELRALIERYVAGKIPQKSYLFALQEAKDKITKENIFNIKEKERLLKYIRQIEADSDVKQLKLVASVLAAEVYSGYWEKLKHNVIGQVSNGKNKKVIDALCANLAVEIQNRGYHKGYIFHKTKKFFFSDKVDPKKVETIDILDDYFELFNGKPKSYDVVFKGRSIPVRLRGLAHSFGISIKTKMPKTYVEARRFDDFAASSNQDRHKLYFLFTVNAVLDPHQAREYAYKQIQFFFDVCRFHNHEVIFEVSEVGYCYNREKKRGYIINPPVAPMQCGLISLRAEEKDRIEINLNILSGLYYSENDRFRFIKMMDYHHAAMQTSSYENQLVSLWVAMESFLPESLGRTSRINHVCSLVLPVLTLNYNEKIIINLANDLFLTGEHVKAHIESAPVDGDKYKKVLQIITTKEMKEWREELYSLIDCHPLLINRCFTIMKMYSAAHKVKQTLVVHKNKVELHLRRIYSTRNMIVHNARYLPYIKTLVENLHGYIDILVLAMGMVGKYNNNNISIQSALEMVRTRESEYFAALEKHGKTQTTIENCEDFILFSENLLSSLL